METDKKIHMACGFTISLVIGLYNIYFGLAASIAAGALKELYDYRHPDSHTCDVMDFIATAGGGVLAFLLLHLGW